jgi:hypothetical protein
MSSGARIGIITGSVVAGLVVVAVAVFFFLRWKKKKDGEESRPMLPQEHPNMSLIPTPDEAVALDNIVSESATDWPKEAKWRPTANPAEHRHSGFNWESPLHLAYPGSDREPPTTADPH